MQSNARKINKMNERIDYAHVCVCVSVRVFCVDVCEDTCIYMHTYLYVYISICIIYCVYL